MLVQQTIQHIKTPIKPIDFNWLDNPSVKNLLDTITSILAEEYVKIAKDNAEVFANEK